MFYEHDGEYIALKIIFKDVVGYYNDYKDNDKTMNFKLDDSSLNKIYDIFEHTEEKLEIDFSDFAYESKGEEYLKTKVSTETRFKNGKDNIIPNETTKYDSKVLLQIQSVYYNMKDKNDIVYYPQVLLE